MLTDEHLEDLLRATFAAESANLTSPPGLSAAIRRRNAVARRRLTLITTAVAVTAVATAVVVVHPFTEVGSGVTPDPSRIELADYTFTLPASYGAQDGSCELTLPDGTTRTGTPGANGACAVLFESSLAPTWLSESPPDGTWTAVAAYDDPRFVTVTITGRDPVAERYLTLVVKRPRDPENELWVEELKKTLDDGVAAAHSGPTD
jgi:hypothetical protein